MFIFYDPMGISNYINAQWMFLGPGIPNAVQATKKPCDFSEQPVTLSSSMITTNYGVSIFILQDRLLPWNYIDTPCWLRYRYRSAAQMIH